MLLIEKMRIVDTGLNEENQSRYCEQHAVALEFRLAKEMFSTVEQKQESPLLGF